MKGELDADQFTKEFEAEAVRLARTSGRAGRDIASDLGVGVSTLTRWVGKHRDRQADISYIWTREGWLYLAVVIDLFARRVVGWAVSDRLRRWLALEALGKALTMRRPSKGLIHHSDRGSQYCSIDYQARLRQQAREAIARYIDGFYIPVRRHSALDLLSPVQFERKVKS